MKKFKTMIYDVDTSKHVVFEVEGFNLSDGFFAYKNDKGYYYLVDKKSGCSLGRFKKLKDLKSNFNKLYEKYELFIRSHEALYKDVIEEFKKLTENLEGDSNE